MHSLSATYEKEKFDFSMRRAFFALKERYECDTDGPWCNKDDRYLRHKIVTFRSNFSFRSPLKMARCFLYKHAVGTCLVLIFCKSSFLPKSIKVFDRTIKEEGGILWNLTFFSHTLQLHHNLTKCMIAKSQKDSSCYCLWATSSLLGFSVRFDDAEYLCQRNTIFNISFDWMIAHT